jgi:tetratricopeptide (TPR) repeat protein
MSMRHYCFLLGVVSALAALWCPPAGAQCGGCTLAGWQKKYPEQVQCGHAPHCVFALYLDSRFCVISMEEKPAQPGEKATRINAYLPLCCCCPLAGKLIGVPSEFLGYYVSCMMDCCLDLDGVASVAKAPPEQASAQASAAQEYPAPSSPHAPAVEKPAAKAPASKNASPFTCPYLKKQGDTGHQERNSVDFSKDGVLDKLQQLQEARVLYQQAEHCRLQGRLYEAVSLYRQAQQHCPGSRFERLATNRLKRLEAGEAAEPGASTSEEQEKSSPSAPAEPEPSARRRKVENQVDQLLAACHQALLDKDFYRAEKLADRALKLDPDRVAANPYVYKMNLLNQVHDHVMKAMPCVPKALPKKAKEKQEQAQEEEQEVEKEQALRPALPPLDPQVVIALEKQKAGLANIKWASSPDLDQFLQQAANVLPGGLCLDIDDSREDGLRVQCEFQVGGVDFKFTWTDTGIPVAVTNLIEGCDD